MAWTFIGATGAQGQTFGTGSSSMTVPAGTIDGDLLIVCALASSSTSADDAGWTKLASGRTGSYGLADVYWRIYDDADGTSFSFSGNFSRVFAMASYRPGALPLAYDTRSFSAATNGTISVSAATAAADDSLVIAVYGINLLDELTFSGYTARHHEVKSSGQVATIQDKQQDTGTTGALSQALSASDDWAAQIVVFNHPASALEGAAVISGDATMVPGTPAMAQTSAGVLAGSSAMDATGETGMTAATVLSGNGAVTVGTPVMTSAGAVTLAGETVVALDTPVMSLAGAAIVTAGSSVDANGIAGTFGAAVLAGDGAVVVGVPVMTNSGAVILTGDAHVDATSSGTAFGEAVLAGDAAVTASAVAELAGATTIQGDSSIDVTGIAGMFGAVTMSGDAVVVIGVPSLDLLSETVMTGASVMVATASTSDRLPPHLFNGALVPIHGLRVQARAVRMPGDGTTAWVAITGVLPPSGV